MACPEGTITGCDFVQALVDEVPRFDTPILRDIRLADSWIGNIAIEQAPVGTPVEITQDRFRAVFPNTTKRWARVGAAGVGCTGNPCDPPEHEIGWGADRLTFYAEQIVWATPLRCYDQDMHITEAVEHTQQIIDDILRPAVSWIFSNFARRRTLQWAKYHHIANAGLDTFTFQWSLADTDGDGTADEEIYFDTSAAPSNVFHLVPQMLQNNYNRSMRDGYAGKNPYRDDTGPFIELVADMDTVWFLSHLGGQQGVGIPNNPSVTSNWRFTDWGESNKYWKYGFSGQLGNYMVRMDELNLRFNFVSDMGPAANGGNGNRYRYQVVLPYENNTTTGAGGSAGIGMDVNNDFDSACFAITFQFHKKGLTMLTPDGKPISPEMPFIHRNFAGQWQFQMHDLGEDINGVAIKNAWGNKGRFASWFKYWARPRHTEFLRAYFHRRSAFCVPEITSCQPCSYPAQQYNSALPPC